MDPLSLFCGSNFNEFMEELMIQTLKQTVFAAAMASLAATPGYAQTRSQVWGGPIVQETQTASVTADVGMTTFESKAADSKETQSTSTYTVAAWAGEGRELGASVQASDAVVPFSLNNSSMKTSFRDVKLMARFLWFIPYVSVSLSE
ncbi:hypothetical protein E3A20_20810, partial [Planctomyces bekefii]